MSRTKNPQKVRAGQARQAKLRAQLGEEGYRNYQRSRYGETIRNHPDFAERGGKAANIAQLESWGTQKYREQRQRAYQACVAKYGDDFASKAIQKAQEVRRRQRLKHPTPSEAALRNYVLRLGCSVLLEDERFDYCTWCLDPSGRSFTPWDAIAECGAGRFTCDLLLPARHLALEVEGGIHLLHREKDALRRNQLEQWGLKVIVLTSDEALDDVVLDSYLRPIFFPC